MMTKNTCSLLLAAVATAVICTSTVVCSSAPSPAPADPTPSSCPWRTVPSPEDPFIQKLGSWAVDQEHTVMKFKKVVSARWQGVGQQCASMFFHNYYYELIIVAALHGSPSPVPVPVPGGDDDEKFRAVVYVVNFSQPQKVISFSHYRPAAN